jgi:hypothetical protein
VLLLVVAVLLGAVALLVLWFRWHAASAEEAQESDYAALFLPVLSAFDFVSDIFFLRALVVETGVWTAWAYLAAASLSLSVAVGLSVSVWFLWAEVHRHAAFAQWFRRHQVITVFGSLLAASNLEVLTVLDCRVGNFAALAAPWLPVTKARLLTLGLLTTVLEDIPQLLVQVATTVNSTQPVSLTTAVALASTVIMLIGSGVRRGFACFVHRHDNQLNKLRQRTEGELRGVVVVKVGSETMTTTPPLAAAEDKTRNLVAMDNATIQDPRAVAEKFASVVASLGTTTPAEKQTLELYAQAVVAMARELTYARTTVPDQTSRRGKIPLASFTDAETDSEVLRLDRLVTQALQKNCQHL